MKFTLKKLSRVALIIFLILIVYKMFLKKYVEGMTTRPSCNTYNNQFLCQSNDCKWNKNSETCGNKK
jgi:hypothetical protein